MSSKIRILVLADDLTGAAEIGGIASQFGLTARIFLGRRPDFSLPEDVLIVDTASRNKEAGAARKLIAEAISGLDTSSFDLVYKKTDSLLRGPVIAEIMELFSLLDHDRALLIPANPSRNRIIRESRMIVEGKLLHETAFKNDPLHPRHSSRLEELLDHNESLVTGNDPETLSSGMIFIPDVASDEDVADVISRVSASSVLHAGASDFFRILLTRRFQLDRYGRTVQLAKRENLHFISGSHAGGHLLANADLSSLGYEVFELPGEAILDETAFGEWTGHVREVIERGGKVVLTGPLETQEDPECIPHIASRMAQAAGMVAKQSAPGSQLMMDGGETASECFRIMGWDQLLVCRAYVVGVVSLQATDTDLLLTVKPGSYHWPDEFLG